MGLKIGKAFKKVRVAIHKTPVVNKVAKGFAGAFGAGEMYDDFDRKNGLGGYPKPNQGVSNVTNIYGPPSQSRGFFSKLVSLFTTGKFA